MTHDHVIIFEKFKLKKTQKLTISKKKIEPHPILHAFSCYFMIPRVFNFAIQYQLVLPILMYNLMDQQMAKNIYKGLFRREKDFFMQVIIENFITKQRLGDIQNRSKIIRQLNPKSDTI